MSCKLLAHPSLFTCICAISIVLAGPCRSSTIPLITIFCCSHHISFCSSFLSYCHQCGLKHFQHHFPALILFGGNWVVEISKISCAGILLGDQLQCAMSQQQYWAGLNGHPCSHVMVQENHDPDPYHRALEHFQEFGLE